MQIKPIQGQEGYYISDTGKVFTTYSGGTGRCDMREMKPFLYNSGYLAVGFRKGNSRSQKCAVHRVVAEHFVE